MRDELAPSGHLVGLTAEVAVSGVEDVGDVGPAVGQITGDRDREPGGDEVDIGCRHRAEDVHVVADGALELSGAGQGRVALVGGLLEGGGGVPESLAPFPDAPVVQRTANFFSDGHGC